MRKDKSDAQRATESRGMRLPNRRAEESIIWDLDDAPPDLVARLREDVEQHIAER